LANLNGADRVPSVQQPILVVEDDETIAQAIDWCLSEEGYNPVIAHNGHEALAWLEQCVPCLILLDMKMPEMDGWAFAAAYRQLKAPHAPIIVLTAAQDSRRRAAEIDAADCIAKPFDIEHFLSVVRRHVGQDSTS
jgi:DNA-binding response OmpR family regulator